MCAATQSEKHGFVKTQPDILNICTPFFNKFNLNYFHFRRTYKDGSFIVLTTNNDWQLYFLSKDKPIYTPIPDEYIDRKIYYALWSGNIPDETLTDAKSSYGIDNPIAIVEAHDNYFDSYSFGAPCSNKKVVNFYFNNIDTLRMFILFFKDKACDLIKSANANKICVPSYCRDPSIEKIIHKKIEQDNNKQLLKLLEPNRYKVTIKNEEVWLTIREFQCFKYVNKGMSSKDIAKLLNISPRTVESYIENIKMKLGCTTKSNLVTIWQDNQFNFII